jgi:tripartite ATP-independent transporter DctM subunit
VLDWLADNLALIMFVSMFFFIFIGYPVAFIMGGLALAFAVFGAWLGTFNLIGLSDIVLRMWGGVANDPVLASIPMFIFMGAILERSGSAKDMLDATEVLLKWCPGALAVSVMVMGTILAAPIGVVGAAVITLSVIALPQMLAAGYDKRLAIGTIASAGTLGILIPPAIMLVVMAEMLSTSAGNLFLAAIMPGFLLSGLYLVYIVLVAMFKPGAAPKLPPGYGPQTRRAFWYALWRGLFPMTALLVIVLGSIFAGWATPTESGAVGVLGSMFIAALNRRMTFKMMNEAIYSSCRANGLVFLIFLGATGFSYVFRVLGGDDLMISTLTHFGIDTKWEMLAFVMVLIFLLGFPFEWIEICLIVLPVFGPILLKYDFSDHIGSNAALMTWFGTLVVGQSADRVHDAAVRGDAVLHEGHGATGRHHERRVHGHVSVRCAPGARLDAVHLFPGHQSVAAEAGRLSRIATFPWGAKVRLQGINGITPLADNYNDPCQ